MLATGSLGALDMQGAITEKTYDQLNGLTLTYNNAPMYGKTVKFTPSADLKTATVALSSSFDLSEIPGIPEDLKQTVAGPGVLPGSPLIILNVELKDHGNDTYTFEGSAFTEYLTFSYSAKLTPNTFDMAITDPELENKTLVGLWNTTPYALSEDGTEILSTPAHIVWTSDKSLAVMEGFELPMETLLQLVVSLPMIDDGTLSVLQVLPEAFKSVEFADDGNLMATLVDEGQTVTSPRNLAQYVVSGDDQFRLFLDPAAIKVADTAKVRALENDPTFGIDINNILGNVIAQLAPMMSEGVPMGYAKADNNLTVYIGEDVLLPLLQNNVVPLLSNAELVQALADMMAQSGDETMASFAPMIPGIAASLVEVINGTTNIEIGLNFTAAPNAVEGIESDMTAERHEVARYDMQGRKVTKDTKGLVIVRYSDGSAAKLMVR